MGALFYASISAFMKVTKMDWNNRLAWILIILCTFPIGALIFFAIRPDKSEKISKKRSKSK